MNINNNKKERKEKKGIRQGASGVDDAGIAMEDDWGTLRKRVKVLAI